MSSPSSPLQQPLHQPLGDIASRHELLGWIWKLKDVSTVSDESFDPFFKYYTQECRFALHDYGNHTTVRQHDDLTGIADSIGLGDSREALVTTLKDQIPPPKPANDTDRVNTSIDLTARLMSMMSIGSLRYGFSGRPELEWNSGSLKDFIHGYYNSLISCGQKTKLEKIFTAKNLNKVAGIDIIWTDNLVDHLKMMHDDKEVAIFSHALFLKNQS
jgi:hypothetical protein